jgi:eukaryotic-like serine/threonine-protein kinase
MADRSATVGARAPAFSLPITTGPASERRLASLADYENRWLMLLFYPRDFSLVCPTELTAVSSRITEFRERECDVLGVSTDALDTHERWLGAPAAQGGLGGLHFPLGSDEDGAVCRAYGVHVSGQNIALRGLFLIDPNGVLQYQVVHSLSVGRSTEEILRVLDGLQTGGICAAERQQGGAVIDASTTLIPNRVIGPYRIEETLGSGAFGTVFRASDLTLQRLVALKVIRPGSPVPAEGLLAEARAAAALNHPNICIIYTVDATLGAPMIVMEFVDGSPLSRLLEEGPLPGDQAIAVGRQIAQGMAAAHAQGVVHGDLKPANVMVTPAGVAKVMDFGLARRDVQVVATDETGVWIPTPDGGISGTPSYMSPEQSRGQPAGPASDVFALGLILYELLTGRRVLAGANLMDVLRRLDRLDPEEYAVQAPEPLAGVLREALVNDPARRRITMAQFADRLI